MGVRVRWASAHVARTTGEVDRCCNISSLSSCGRVAGSEGISIQPSLVKTRDGDRDATRMRAREALISSVISGSARLEFLFSSRMLCIQLAVATSQSYK